MNCEPVKLAQQGGFVVTLNRVFKSQLLKQGTTIVGLNLRSNILAMRGGGSGRILL